MATMSKSLSSSTKAAAGSLSSPQRDDREKQRYEVHRVLMGFPVRPKDGGDVVEAAETTAAKAVLLHELAMQLHEAVRAAEPEMARSRSVRQELLRLGMISKKAASMSCDFAELVADAVLGDFYSTWSEADQGSLLELHQSGILGAVEVGTVRQVLTMDPIPWAASVKGRSREDFAEHKRLEDEAQARRKKLEAEAKQLEEEAEARRRVYKEAEENRRRPAHVLFGLLQENLIVIGPLQAEAIAKRFVELAGMEDLPFPPDQAAGSTPPSTAGAAGSASGEANAKTLLERVAQIKRISLTAELAKSTRFADACFELFNPGGLFHNDPRFPAPGKAATNAFTKMGPVAVEQSRIDCVMGLLRVMSPAAIHNAGETSRYFVGRKGNGKSHVALALATATAIEGWCIGRPVLSVVVPQPLLQAMHRTSKPNTASPPFGGPDVTESSTTASLDAAIARLSDDGKGLVGSFLVDPDTPVWYGLIAAGCMPPLPEEELDFALEPMNLADERKRTFQNRLPNGDPAPGVLLVLDEFQEYFEPGVALSGFFGMLRPWLETLRGMSLVVTGSSSILPELIRRTSDDLQLVGMAGGSSTARSPAITSLNTTKLRPLGRLGGILPGRAFACAAKLAKGKAGRQFRTGLRSIVRADVFDEIVRASATDEPRWSLDLEILAHAAGGNPRAFRSLVEDAALTASAVAVGDGRPMSGSLPGAETVAFDVDEEEDDGDSKAGLVDALVASAIGDRHAAMRDVRTNQRKELDLLCKAIGAWAIRQLGPKRLVDRSPGALGLEVRRLCGTGREIELDSLFKSAAGHLAAWQSQREHHGSMSTEGESAIVIQSWEEIATAMSRSAILREEWTGMVRQWDDRGILSAGTSRCAVSLDDSLWVHTCLIDLIRGGLTLRQVQAMLDPTSMHSTRPLEAMIAESVATTALVDAARQSAARAGYAVDEEVAEQLSEVLGRVSDETGRLFAGSAAGGAHAALAGDEELPAFRLWMNQRKGTTPRRLHSATGGSLELGRLYRMHLDAAKTDAFGVVRMDTGVKKVLPSNTGKGACLTVGIQVKARAAGSADSVLSRSTTEADLEVMESGLTEPHPVAGELHGGSTGLDILARSSPDLESCDHAVSVIIYASQRLAQHATKARGHAGDWSFLSVSTKAMPEGSQFKRVTTFRVVLDGYALEQLYGPEIQAAAQSLDLHQFLPSKRPDMR